MKVVVVGFKVGEENSVYYKKIKVEEETVNLAATAQQSTDFKNPKVLAYALIQAYLKGADFVSIRFIRDGKVS